MLKYLIALLVSVGCTHELPHCRDVGCSESPCTQPDGSKVQCEGIPSCGAVGCESDCTSGTVTCSEACEC